uniref:Uncharacterized protein n=1 Tax=Caenorhabditis japonica TaxID=281687 RepID=A0A8R1IBP4_CAEJA
MAPLKIKSSPVKKSKIAKFRRKKKQPPPDSLIQVDPLAAALAHQARKANTVPAVSRTPLLLQFTPFGPPPSSCRSDVRLFLCL